MLIVFRSSSTSQLALTGLGLSRPVVLLVGAKILASIGGAATAGAPLTSVANDCQRSKIHSRSLTMVNVRTDERSFSETSCGISAGLLTKSGPWHH